MVVRHSWANSENMQKNITRSINKFRQPDLAKWIKYSRFDWKFRPIYNKLYIVFLNLLFLSVWQKILVKNRQQCQRVRLLITFFQSKTFFGFNLNYKFLLLKWFISSELRGASKIKVKSMYKKRMATARRLIFLGVSQGVHFWSGYTVVFIITKLRRQWQWRQRR